VQSDLEAIGYEVLPFLLPACAKDAPHRRDRIWFIAYTYRNGHEPGRLREDRPTTGAIEANKQERQRVRNNDWRVSESRAAAKANGSGRKEQHAATLTTEQKFNSRVTMHPNSASKQGEYIGQAGEGKLNGPDSRDGIDNWQNFPTQPPICSGDDGLPTELDGITFPKWRNESIKAYGNAVVPQVVYEIFKAINQSHTQ
jgi:DNA (cytosine-5)-methyltransferase 1